MPITINTNVAAMGAQRNLNAASTRSQSSLSKLSSGSRVPTAKEDAASLSVGTGLKLDVTAYKAAQTNAMQASSLLQIADGAFGQISNILDRMKSLATTAQSGQLSSTERSYLDGEYSNLRNEIDRIVKTTEFNGIELLGSTTTMTVDTIGADINNDAGFVGIELDGSLMDNDDTFAVFYDDSEGTLTVSNNAKGTAQTIKLGDTGDDPVGAGATRKLDFNQIGVKLTLSDDFNGGNAIGSGGADIGTAGEGVVGHQFKANASGTTSATTLDFQVGIGSGGVAGGDSIQVTLAEGSFQELINDADANGNFTDAVSTTISDITSAANAGTATVQVDAAIFSVNTARAEIGSNLNRLEFAQSNLSVSIENTEAARSTLMDVDVAAEMTSFTSQQVLIQAGVSMLAQANQQPSLLLSLLQ